MKKGLIISLIAIFVLSISSFVLAEDMTGKSSVGLDLSYFSCDGWDDDEWDQAGLLVEGVYRYFINENVAIGGSIGYWSDKKSRGTWESTLTIIPILFNATYFLGASDSDVRPYLGASLGLFSSKVEWEYEEITFDPVTWEMITNTVSESKSASPIGFRLGGGVEYQVSSKVSLTGDLKYQILSIDFEDSDEDCDANGLIIGAGINLLF